MASWKKVIVSGSAAELLSVTLDTDLAVTEGGTGASTATAARSNLGVGTAGTRADSYFATGAEGDLATSAQQPPSEGAFADGDKTKLDGLEASATADQTADEIGVLFAADNTTVQFGGAVSASSLNTATTITIAGGLFTSASLAAAVAGIYTHPSYDGDDLSVDTTALTGANVISDIDFNITTDATGHVTDATLTTLATRTLTLANLGYTGATDANNYTLPTNLAGDDISVDTGALTGATVISDLDFNIETNTSGLVTDANGTVSTRTLTLANLGYTGDTDATDNMTGAEIGSALNASLGNVSFGNQSADSVTFAGPVVVTGNLTVNGTTTTIATANLTVTDQFVVLNDGGSAADGGIVIEGAGTALGWDESESRWGVEHDGAAEGDTALDPDAYISCVVTSDLSNYRKNGNIKISSGDIFIYVE